MCQLFISKDFETSLLTLFGVSLVLWRRKADNEHSNPLFYCPSPLNSQHLHFQFTVASLLKIFVRSRRDWEKKCREGSRQQSSFILNLTSTLLSHLTRLQVACASWLCTYCSVILFKYLLSSCLDAFLPVHSSSISL